MRCAIPTCDSDRDTSSGISLHRLPDVQFLYAAWEKAFSKAGLRLKPGSVVCSKHFLDKDMLDSTSGRQVRSGVLPIVKQNVPDEDSMSQCNVKVCRICFSTDCKLYSMTTSDTLNEAYEKLTGLTIAEEEHLPRSLCGQCAGRVVECERFRSQSLRAHVMLLDVFRRHGAVTLELIQSTIRPNIPADSSPSHNPCNGFDQHNIQLEEVYTLTDARGDAILDDTCIDDVKTVIDYVLDQSVINGDDITNNEVDEVKTEIDDLFSQDNVYASPSNVDEDIDIDVVTNANYDANSQDNCSDCSSNVDEDVVVDVGVENRIKEDNTSDEDFIDEKINEPLVYSAGLYEHSVDNVLKITLRDDQDYKSSEELSNNSIHSFVFVGEDVLRNSALREAKQEICKPVRVTKRKNTSQDLNELATEHQPVHDDGGPSIGDVLRCDICSYQTVRDIQLLEHLKAHAADGSFMCDICGYKTTSKNVLGRHMQVHSLRKTYSSKVCKKMFSPNNQLNVHTKTHLNRPLHSCDICKKRFKTKITLSKHAKTHLELKPYTCQICDKDFHYQSYLEAHLKVHSSDKPYNCDVCGKGFRDKYNLRRHLSVHSGEKQSSRTACNVCKKLLSVKSSLRNHMRIHSGEKPYSCEICKKQFREIKTLKNHLKIHTGEKSFKCDLCNGMFRVKESLKRHIKRLHSGKPKKRGRRTKKTSCFGRHGHARSDITDDYGTRSNI